MHRRLEGYGITGSQIVARADQTIVVAIPPVDAPQDVADHLSALNLFEIIDPLGQYLPEGTVVHSTLGGPEVGDPQGQHQATPGVAPYRSLVSSVDIQTAYLTPDPIGSTLQVGFELTEAAGATMFEFTSTHLGQPISLVLDKRVLVSPSIHGAIAENGVIPARTAREAAFLVVSLAAGALPASLQTVSTNTVGVVGSSGATLYDVPSQLGREVVSLSPGTLLLAAGEAEVGIDGRSWVPVWTLADDESGYVHVDSLK